MTLLVTQVRVQWPGVVGATGYEIRVDGVKRSTTGATGRTSLVSVGNKNKVEVFELPKKLLVQELDFEQKDGTV